MTSSEQWLSAEVVLEGRGVGKVFGSGDLAVRALHPSDLQVRRGEVTLIAGPSGSGKTTLLSMLGLVLSPSEGEVWISGERVQTQNADSLAALRRCHIGFIFQQFNLLSGINALENVEVPLMLNHAPARERRERALAALTRVGLADRALHKPRALSGGQQQRVAIARALVSEASILLCDEPTASLDVGASQLVLEILASVARESDRAVVIVTHDPRVMAIGDRLIEVHDGRITERRPLITGHFSAGGTT